MPYDHGYRRLRTVSFPYGGSSGDLVSDTGYTDGDTFFHVAIPVPGRSPLP